jgi:hypothetical protein
MLAARAHLIVLPQMDLPDETMAEIAAQLERRNHSLTVVAEGYCIDRRPEEQSASDYLLQRLAEHGFVSRRDRRVMAEPYSRYIRGVRPLAMENEAIMLKCGLLLDEWTEVIPSRDETAGLTFHYDQPNSEPPQTLLLVTPRRFTGRWQWQDLVDTLHETLDMARKRAVEPDQVDGTVYSRFLPPIVSLASPLPLTATLNLALNNQVFFAKVTDNE